MDLTAHQTKRRNAIIRLIIISTILGFSYTILAGEWGDIRAMLNGTLIGFFGSIIVSIFEFKIFNPHYRKLSFLVVISLKTLLYFLAFIIIITGVKGYVDSLFKGIGFLEYIKGDDFNFFIKQGDFKVILSYTFFFLATITFTIQMSRKIGYSTLVNMITGKYHEPREEDRIFMLIDLKSSVTIAEKFGNLRYHQFLNEFYYVITKCIFTTKGNIYRYVGDEIMVSWKLKTGLNNFNCLRTYFYIKSEIRKHRERFLSHFNLVPEFTTCFHEGKVVVGEIGEVKSQIVFSGETLSELQKLKKASATFQKNLIISEILINQIDLPPIYSKEVLGSILLNGDEQALRVYTLTELEP